MSFFTYLIKPFSAFLDLIYPELCQACHLPLLENETSLCLFCEHNLYIAYQKEDTVLLRFAEQPIDAIIGLMDYQKKGYSQELINKVKYKEEIALGVYLGKKLGVKIIESNSMKDIDFIIPVPLHYKKHKKRGFNQANIIAKGIAVIIDKPILTNVLTKVTHNKTQTKKGRMARWENTDYAYKLKDIGDQLKGKNILLVDDVLTSGATLTSCTKELTKAKINKKYIAVLAIAVSN